MESEVVMEAGCRVIRRRPRMLVGATDGLRCERVAIAAVAKDMMHSRVRLAVEGYVIMWHRMRETTVVMILEMFFILKCMKGSGVPCNRGMWRYIQYT